MVKDAYYPLIWNVCCPHIDTTANEDKVSRTKIYEVLLIQSRRAKSSSAYRLHVAIRSIMIALTMNKIVCVRYEIIHVTIYYFHNQ